MSVTNSSLNILPSSNDTNQSIVKGIFAPDVVISNLLNTGLQDLRNNKWELNLVFNYMLDQTNLGEKEKQRAIKWFNETNIPVLWNLNLRLETFPCFSYSLEGGDLQEQTLAWIDSEVKEDKKAEVEAITSKFTPSYNSATGIVTIPSEILSNYNINETMVLVNYDGQQFDLSTLDLETGEFNITINLVVTLKNCYIKESTTRLSSGIESASFKDIIRVGIHSINDPVHAIWMFSICKYILLKYNKDLLEGRGFECLGIQYGPYYKDPILPAENITSRIFTLTGKVRDYWSSYQSEKAGSVSVIPSYTKIDQETLSTDTFGSEANITDPGYLVLLEQDPTGFSG